MGKYTRWIMGWFAGVVGILILLVLSARTPLFSDLLPERSAHALRCLSDSLFGIEGDAGSLAERLAYEQRDAGTRQALLLSRERIENYFDHAEAYVLSLARHHYIQELFQRPNTMFVRDQAEKFAQGIVAAYVDVEEVILGRGREVLSRGSHRAAIPYSGENIAPFLHLVTEREGGIGIYPIHGRGLQFLLLAPLRTNGVSDREYVAVILNSNILLKFLNSYPRQDTQGMYLVYEEDKRFWLSAGGEDGIAARVRSGNAPLARYKTERFIDFGDKRFRNISIPLRYAEDKMFLGALEGEVEDGWYLPFLLEGALLFFSILAFAAILIAILRRIVRTYSLHKHDKAQGTELLGQALDQSQENCRNLIESSKKLVRQTTIMQTHIRKVALPAVDIRLQSNLLMSAEPDLAHLRRLISAPPLSAARREREDEHPGFQGPCADRDTRRAAGGD